MKTAILEKIEWGLNASRLLLVLFLELYIKYRPGKYQENKALADKILAKKSEYKRGL